MASAVAPADLTASDETRTERHLRLLAELAELGMTLARTVVAQAEEAPSVGDPGLMLSRIARAVRQTLALEAKLAEDHQVRRQRETRELGFRRQAKVRRIVEQAIEADADDSEIDNLLCDLNERLDDRDDTDFTDRPLIEVVAAICRDLGVTFDPSLWQDEDWAIEDPSPPPGPLTAQPTTPPTPGHPGFREAKDRDP
jgi:hypothetical protein